MKKLLLKSVMGLMAIALQAEVVHSEQDEYALPSGHTINFQEVPVVEFIRFVSKIAEVNFIFNHKELQFNVSLSSGKPLTPDQMLKALIQILKVHGLYVQEEEGYLVVQKVADLPEGMQIDTRFLGSRSKMGEFDTNKLLASLEPTPAIQEVEPKFLVHKLQYHSGEEIEPAIKKIAAELASKPETSHKYLSALQSVQWVKTTNSLVFSGDDESLASVKKLVDSLDAALRQVFIEVLVIETDVKRSSEFGLQWAAGGKYKDSLGFGMGNFPPSAKPSPFASAFQEVSGQNSPMGSSQIPLGSGFDMGVIGDIIMHRGMSYFSLGSLVSALQMDGDSSIVLNQKIITQDNKNSTIFVGDNIPFTGSVVQTVGQSQQTTANVEYRDIGVMLSITPRLGQDDVITLDLSEEITEAIPTMQGTVSSSHVAGIQTTKTNMMTHVHVPDKHFLVLSGMIRNSHMQHKSGIPCLGGLPVVGNLFSKNQKRNEKRNMIIFVRPHIIHSIEDYRKLTEHQEELYQRESAPANFSKGLELVK